jgi:hypothetical protein
MQFNVLFGWIWILTGLAAGAGIGLFFHRPRWLGGYDSWPRRMVRLGHISFIGTGLLNISFGLSVIDIEASGFRLAPSAFVMGAVAMPGVCFLSALDARFRHLFFIPVVSLVVAAVEVVWRGFVA